MGIAREQHVEAGRDGGAKQLAGADPRFAQMLSGMAEGRRRSAAQLARSLARDKALRARCGEKEARDVMYALASPELYELLVTRSGWSDAKFETWLSNTLATAVLGTRR